MLVENVGCVVLRERERARNNVYSVVNPNDNRLKPENLPQVTIGPNWAAVAASLSLY